MMRAINIFFLLCVVATSAYSSDSIYGSAFDYRNARPASVYFGGKTQTQIKAFCDKDASATMDLSACAQFRFEIASRKLGKRVAQIENIMTIGDKDHQADDEPTALPYFKKAQANWQLYRDNQCYASVYEVGQASLRFVDFWDCMTRTTKARLDDLTKPNAGE
jgi:uncharacterized protein YecT (DUF1311 family)